MGYTGVCTGHFTMGAKWKVRKRQDWEIADGGNFALGMLVALKQSVTVPPAGMWAAKDLSLSTGQERKKLY